MRKIKPTLDILTTMLMEFDYERNGKEESIKFLAQMIQYFLECDFDETIKT